MYHYIDFPDEATLKKIVEAHTQDLSDEVVSRAIHIFSHQIRETLSEGDKKPATSELIEWLQMINYYTALKNNSKQTPNEAEKALMKELDKLAGFDQKKGKYLSLEQIPYRQILLKTPSALFKHQSQRHYE